MTAFPCWNSSVHCGLWAVMSRGGWWWGRWLYTPHLTLELYRGVCMCVYEYTVNQMLSMSHFRISFIYMSHTTAPFSVIIWKGIFLPSIFFLYPDLSATTVQLQLQYDWVTLSTQQPPPPPHALPRGPQTETRPVCVPQRFPTLQLLSFIHLSGCSLSFSSSLSWTDIRVFLLTFMFHTAASESCDRSVM